MHHGHQFLLEDHQTLRVTLSALEILLDADPLLIGEDNNLEANAELASEPTSKDCAYAYPLELSSRN